jgi:hypothetical protein
MPSLRCARVEGCFQERERSSPSNLLAFIQRKSYIEIVLSLRGNRAQVHLVDRFTRILCPTTSHLLIYSIPFDTQEEEDGSLHLESLLFVLLRRL